MYLGELLLSLAIKVIEIVSKDRNNVEMIITAHRYPFGLIVWNYVDFVCRHANLPLFVQQFYLAMLIEDVGKSLCDLLLFN